MSWWAAAADRSMVVACEGAEHRVRWSAGQVELLDHPDLDAELALVALGGVEPACVSVHRLWADAVADGGFLGEWVDESRLRPSWFSWLAMALERMRTEGFHEFLRPLPPARAQRMGEFLHRFPVPLIDRAAATVSWSVTEGDGVACSLAPPLLASAIASRVRRAFVDGVGGRQLAVGAAALVPLDIAITAERPAVAGALTGPERGVSLTVERTWLHRVWAAETALLEGRLVLGLRPTGGERACGAPTAVASTVAWSDGGRSGDGGGEGEARPQLVDVPVALIDGVWRQA